MFKIGDKFPFIEAQLNTVCYAYKNNLIIFRVTVIQESRCQHKLHVVNQKDLGNVAVKSIRYNPPKKGLHMQKVEKLIYKYNYIISYYNL